MSEYSRICPECKKEFLTRRVDKLFDTSDCRIRYNNQKGYKKVKSKLLKADAMEASIKDFIYELATKPDRSEERKKILIDDLGEKFNGIYKNNRNG